MTTQVTQPEVTQEEATPTLENVLAISFDGNSVHVQMRSDITIWQALGLLKTAETILLDKYNSLSKQ